MLFFWRVLPGIDRSKVSYSQRALDEMSKRPATVTLCAFQHDWWINEVVKSRYARPAMEASFNENSALAIGMAQAALKRGSKAVVYTLPNFKHMAYFNWYPASELVNANVSYVSPYGDTRGVGAQVLFLPTANVARLFSQVRAGQTTSATLNDSDVVTADEINYGSPQSFNERMRREASQQGLAIVDLEALYQRIAEGRYVTDDGLAIDGLPRGNFFSADGIYPSLIGHAVIANETIKVLISAITPTFH